MKTKQDHLNLIKKKGYFKVDCIEEIFTKEEFSFLEKYGHWLEALADGSLTPLNMKQEQFVRVAKGEFEPENMWEHAWFKLMECKRVNSQPGDIKDREYLPYEDTFYNREMVKQVRGMMYGEMKKNYFK